jgi:hypothetical protein
VEDRDALIATIRMQGAAFSGWGAADTPFYAKLAELLAEDCARGGPVTRPIAPYGDAPFAAAYVLRLLGGIHRMALSGEAPDLAAHFPSTGGDGDARAAMIVLEDVMVDPPATVLDALTRPPQTNEVSRSAALGSGLFVIADRTRLPVRLRELGASGGLNLRPDRYWYEQGELSWGDRASGVRFEALWDGGMPPFAAGIDVVDRRGCDQDPIDAGDPEGALTLLSYIWPEPSERFTRARAAMDIAREVPVVIDRADAAAWVADQCAAPIAGTTLVVYHSVVWQYLPEPTQTAVRESLRAAGARASADAPLAWLRLEPTPNTYVPAELRLTLWDGTPAPHEWLLATTGFHGGPIAWRGPDEP